MRSAAPYAILVLALFACEGAFEAPSIEHPIPDSISASPERLVRFTQGEKRTEGSPWVPEIDEMIASSRPGFTVGQREGPSEYALGDVIDAAISSSGELYVLDRQTSGVSVYDSTGEFKYQIGRRGDGPGEFGAPAKIALTSERELIVLDMWQRIHRFSQTGEGLEYQDRLEIDAAPRDICRTPSFWIVHVTGRERILDRYGEGFTFSESFAVPYRYSTPLIRDRVNRGGIACSKESERIFYAPSLSDRIEAYDAGTGRLRWHTRLEQLAPGRIVEENDGTRVTTGIFDDPFYHALVRIVTGPGVPLIVQYARVEREAFLARTGEFGVETYAFDQQTGEGAFLSREIPQILYIDGSSIVFYRPLPYPQIEVRRFSRLPEGS